MRDRVPYFLSVMIAAASVAAGIWKQDGPMIALSAMAFILSAVSLAYCRGDSWRIFVIASVTVLICTLIMVTAASHQTLVDEGTMSEYTWTYVAALVRGVAIISLILAFYFATAAAFKASYNWVSAGGLAWLIGMGMQVPMFVLMFMIEVPGAIDSVIGNEPAVDIVSNASIVIGMLINLAMFMAFSLYMGRVFVKRRWLITANGLEVRR
ncbi:MAG: hypothetical protein LBV13_06305 [Methanomassiliicoccaceae archaeon]|jgi:hypothetical protein|nr:hypothetical protein [Methanomassiliicoccaceae archaeon]